MKTLLISEIFPPKVGGSGRWFWEMYSRLPRENYIIAAGADERSGSFDLTHDLECLRWPLTLPTWGIATLHGMKGYFRLFSLLRSLIKKEHITAIHCGRCLPEGLLGWLVWKWTGIPYLCYAHGEEINIFNKSRELFWLSRIVYSGASQVIVNTENTRNLLRCYDCIPDSRIKVLNPGVDASFFHPEPENQIIRKQLGWEGRKIILTVGRLQKRKGHDHTIRSILHLKDRVPEILYAIIGDGEEYRYLQELVNNDNLQQYVQFLGKVDDSTLRNCYQQCDIFILANREVDGDIEGFGMVLVEAQACGKPVIAGESGGTAETMLLGKTGIIVDCTSPELIANAVENLLNDKDKRKIMGQNAAQWAREKFDWQSLVLKAENIFTN